MDSERHTKNKSSTSRVESNPADDQSITATATDTTTLQFLSITHPSQLHASRLRHAVRSHVTRRQHQQNPRTPINSRKPKRPIKTSRSRQKPSLHVQNDGPNELSSPTQAPELVSTLDHPDTPSDVSVETPSDVLPTSKWDQHLGGKSPEHSEEIPPLTPSSLQLGLQSSEQEYGMLYDPRKRGTLVATPCEYAMQSILPSTMQSINTGRPLDKVTSKISLMLNSSVGTQSVKGLCIDTRYILDHYVSISQPRILSVERGPSDRCDDETASQSFAFTCTSENPAPFFAALLLAITHLRRLRGETAMQDDQVRLRAHALYALHGAVENSSHEVGDPVIVAIVIMATYEVIYGQLESYHAHIQGLIQIIRLRGGVADLGPNDIFQRLVVWFDKDIPSSLASELHPRSPW